MTEKTHHQWFLQAHQFNHMCNTKAWPNLAFSLLPHFFFKSFSLILFNFFIKKLRTSRSLILLQGDVLDLTSTKNNNKQLCLMAGRTISACLSARVRWRCCRVYSPPCTFCNAVGRFKAHLLNYTCRGDCGESAQVTHYVTRYYSWWFFFVLLAFYATGAAVSQAKGGRHPGWLLHVQHGAMC